jgi:hypothetical protein
MRNFYFLLFPALLLTSCGTIVDYVGNSYAPSNKVDVFVTLSSVKKEYQIIGKGYVYSGATPFVRRLGEKVQKKALQKARSKGADAIVIQDYLLVKPVLQADSIGSGVAIGNIAVREQIQNQFTVLFLKYTAKN